MIIYAARSSFALISFWFQLIFDICVIWNVWSQYEHRAFENWWKSADQVDLSKTFHIVYKALRKDSVFSLLSTVNSFFFLRNDPSSPYLIPNICNFHKIPGSKIKKDELNQKIKKTNAIFENFNDYNRTHNSTRDNNAKISNITGGFWFYTDNFNFYIEKNQFQGPEIY